MLHVVTGAVEQNTDDEGCRRGKGRGGPHGHQSPFRPLPLPGGVAGRDCKLGAVEGCLSTKLHLLCIVSKKCPWCVSVMILALHAI